MNNYVIFTDTGCDINAKTLEQWNISCVDLKFRFDGEDRDYVTKDMLPTDFYQKMREGKVSKTSAANLSDFISAFEPYLQEGKDILYLGFSSGLSNTVSSSRIAAEELKEKYPERKLIIIDTLCASGGQGLVVYFSKQKRDEGANITENAKYVEEILPRLCHWFTVDDLAYLKRGGRISAASAFVGGVLSIKPVMHVDDEGHLINMMKVRGRNQAIKAMVDKYTELAEDKENGVYFITHGDCLEDAKLLESYIAELHGNNHATIIDDIGPVIGSHTGPGVLALFFLGKHR